MHACNACRKFFEIRRKFSSSSNFSKFVKKFSKFPNFFQIFRNFLLNFLDFSPNFWYFLQNFWNFRQNFWNFSSKFLKFSLKFPKTSVGKFACRKFSNISKNLYPCPEPTPPRGNFGQSNPPSQGKAGNCEELSRKFFWQALEQGWIRKILARAPTEGAMALVRAFWRNLKIYSPYDKIFYKCVLHT